MRINAYNLKVILFDKFERYKLYEQLVYIPENNGEKGKRGEAKDRDESIRQSMRRAREKINGYILANDWEYWATQTFRPEALDRFSLDDIVKKYNQRLYNLKKNKYNYLSWLIVPEQHKNGAWHLHLLMSGIPKNRVVYSGYDYYNKNKNYSRPIYNWLDTIDYGYNDYVYIGDIEPIEKLKIATYISKYITKELAMERFNKKMYWVTRGLKLPKVIKTITTNIDDLISDNNILISESKYHIKDKETGQIFNSVQDIIYYAPYEF